MKRVLTIALLMAFAVFGTSGCSDSKKEPKTKEGGNLDLKERPTPGSPGDAGGGGGGKAPGGTVGAQ